MFQIQKAKREKLKASIVCEGLQGSGRERHGHEGRRQHL